MFFDENQAIELCESDPSVIFNLIDENFDFLVDKVLQKKIVSVNTTNENGTDVITYLLKNGWYDLVLKYMKDKTWDVNHQDKDGNTFAHILVTKKYLDVMDIIKQIIKNKDFMPNIRNKVGETILDKSINEEYIYTTVKILEDERFNNIDLVSFKNLYEKYIKSNNYGVYSKMNNLEVIIDTLSIKELLPNLGHIINTIKTNIDNIKKDVKNGETSILDELIYGAME
jgi:hypothetical protein